MKHEAVADFYNDIKEKFGDNYEDKRWFKSPVTRSHFKMMTEALSNALSGFNFKDCFELGPGAGTWTRLLRNLEPGAYLTLVDISDTMLGIAKKNLSTEEHIEYAVSDFLLYNADKTFDLFFSSRAIEYIVDKDAAVSKMSALLTDGGHGVVVTKNPRYWGDALLFREVPPLHKNQIKPSTLCALLQKHGLEVLSLRPATVTVPFCKSSVLNDIAFRLLKHSWISFIHPIFAESYVVHFRKHGS
jgi:ubiquinone/menaquinone biosynthesis C-methylase UbiE